VMPSLGVSSMNSERFQPLHLPLLVYLLGIAPSNHQNGSAFVATFLLYSLTSIVGAGLIVNALLKEYTGRPRPREVVEFGGNWEYRAALELGIPGQGQSFPCGHCTMGFIFASGVMFWNYSPPVAIGSLALGIRVWHADEHSQTPPRCSLRK
jgi:membrane-associated PAP2 superfamily phosphatase